MHAKEWLDDLNVGKKSGPSSSAGWLDVSVLYIALDGRARASVQRAFDRIAQSYDTSTAEGLTGMLREVCIVLRRAKDSWVYAAVTNRKPMAAEVAEGEFQRLVDAARSRYQEELTSNVDGVITRGAVPDIQPTTAEGPGLVLVTIAVAAQVELWDVPDPSNGDMLRAALEAMSQLNQANLVAVDIIWTPSAENDRMSSIELETLYPNMQRIQGSNTVGHLFCGYCGGLYPGELTSCPHCGARTDRSGTE